MKMKHCLIMGASALLLLCNSCTDKDYDLSNIDTTASFKVKELTVPINLEYLTLDQVMDLKEGSEIVKEKDAAGNDIYAVKKEGTFNSSAVSVKQITAPVTIDPTNKDLSMAGTPTPVPGGFTVNYNITSIPPTTFKANATSIDESILRVDTIGIASRLITRIKITPKDGSVDWSKVKIKDLKIQFPKGIICTANKGNFKPANPGVSNDSLLDLTGTDLTVNNAGQVEEIQIDIKKYVAKGNDKVTFNSTAHTLDISDQVNILAGKIELTSTSSTTIPSSVNILITPAMDPLTVTAFTGQVEYKVNDFNIDPIDLSNLPDFLNQEGTRLGLENPQIYLGINNPLGDVKNTASSTTYMHMQTGFSMTPERDGVKGATQTLDPDPLIPGETKGKIRIGGGTTAEQCFVVAPTDPKPNYYPGYTNPKHVPFTGLKQILKETDGIPTKITVVADEPKLPTQNVYNLELGKDYGTVNGRYTFYAPLQLSNDTRISYTDTIDGWNDADVDAMTFSRIKMNMLVSTEVPFPVTLQIVPITVGGKAISGASSNIVEIPALAKDRPIELIINATVNHLDGLLLKAKAQNPDDTVVLGPEMKLYIKNSKATLTGNYTKEL